jgi:hypothetical protein
LWEWRVGHIFPKPGTLASADLRSNRFEPPSVGLAVNTPDTGCPVATSAPLHTKLESLALDYGNDKISRATMIAETERTKAQLAQIDEQTPDSYATWTTTLPEQPPWTDDLSRMPAPYNLLPNPAANWRHIVMVDPVREKALALRRRCGVCGYVLFRDRPVYRHLPPDQPPLGTVFLAPGVSPMHRSCAIYSAIVCPWLKSPRSRGRRTGLLRGEMLIAGFQRYGVAMHTPEHPTFLTYGYVDPVEVIACGSDWNDLLPEYEKALTDEKIDADRLYWTDGVEDQARLAEYARMDETVLNDLWYDAVPVFFLRLAQL